MLVARLLMALVLAVAGISLLQPATAGAACAPRTVIAIGGFNDGQANVFPNGSVDVKVQYSGSLNDMEGGIRALTDTVNRVKRDCPGTTPVITGHSQGGAIAHVYLQRNPGGKIGVLFGEPKMAPTGASKGIFALGGPPVAGVDANFGGNPTVSLCQKRDGVCNDTPDGWIGYAQGVHGQYPFNNVRGLAGRTGVIWLG